MAKALRKKKWYRILATPDFKNKEIGETYLSNPQRVIGKRVKVTLNNLIGDFKKQNIYVIFKINELKGDQLNTEIDGYEIVSAHIKRLIRKGKGKVDDSFIATFKDGVKIRIKPFVLTRRKTTNKIFTDIRARTKQFIIDYCLKNDMSRLVNDLISMRLRKELKFNLNKIYPVSVVEIKKFNRVNVKK